MNENITTQNLWDSVKAVPRGKVHSNTSLPLQLAKEEMKGPGVSRRKEITKIRA